MSHAQTMPAASETTPAATAKPAKRQFVICKFAAASNKTYTYHSDDHKFAKGDFGIVPSRTGEARVEVVATTYEKPSYATKAIEPDRTYAEGGVEYGAKRASDARDDLADADNRAMEPQDMGAQS